jgi:hypothetical protein
MTTKDIKVMLEHKPSTQAPPQRIEELESHARKTLNRLAFDFYSMGSEDEDTLDKNRHAWRR